MSFLSHKTGSCFSLRYLFASVQERCVFLLALLWAARKHKSALDLNVFRKGKIKEKKTSVFSGLRLLNYVLKGDANNKSNTDLWLSGSAHFLILLWFFWGGGGPSRVDRQ